MDLRQRVLEYCKRKNIAVSRFEKECNLANGYFNQVKKRPSLDKIESISRAFPDLNTDWLLTGEGEMLRQNIQQAGDNATQVQGTNNHVSSPRVLEMAMTEIAEQRKLVAKSQEQIDRLITLLERTK